MTSWNFNPRQKVTIEQIATVAAGEGGPALEAQVRAAAASDQRVSEILKDFSNAITAMRGDAMTEPPADVVARAKALGVRLESRRAESISPVAILGKAFDRAGAVVLDWLQPDGELALAGVRDDRGADVLEAVIDSAEIVIRAERTPAQNGIVRLVGEVARTDDMPVRATVALLDASGMVIATDETDSIGMFAIALTRDAREVAVSARAATGELHPTIVLPLGPASKPASKDEGAAG